MSRHAHQRRPAATLWSLVAQVPFSLSLLFLARDSQRRLSTSRSCHLEKYAGAVNSDYPVTLNFVLRSAPTGTRGSRFMRGARESSSPPASYIRRLETSPVWLLGIQMEPHGLIGGTSWLARWTGVVAWTGLDKEGERERKEPAGWDEGLRWTWMC